MQLTQDEVQVIRDRFESFGRAAVERDLAQPERRILMSPEMTDLAQTWLEETGDLRRRELWAKGLMIAAGIEFGVSVSHNLIF